MSSKYTQVAAEDADETAQPELILEERAGGGTEGMLRTTSFGRAMVLSPELSCQST